MLIRELRMATTKKQVAKLATDAALVFVGKVVKLKAATMEGLAGDNTAIVQVERVLSAPEMFRAIVGHELTVRVGKNVALRKGGRLTFFANGWVFGTSLAVDVVGTADATDAEALTPALRAASGATSDAALAARLDSAAMALAGKVAKVDRSPLKSTHISEHDPDWHEATIEVDEVIKGKKGVKQVKVLFPSSDDVRWHKVAKYVAGQQGVFLLQKSSTKQSRAGVSAKLLAAIPAGPEVFTTLHPSDFLPLNELERVRALVGK
jgi:hypothetical protein